MSDTVIQSNGVRCASVLDHLSEEFQQVVERIQGELSELSLGGLEPEVMASVDAAEQTVDALALDLQQGQGDRDAWKRALFAYEAAWHQVVQSLGDRRN